MTDESRTAPVVDQLRRDMVAVCLFDRQMRAGKKEELLAQMKKDPALHRIARMWADIAVVLPKEPPPGARV